MRRRGGEPGGGGLGKKGGGDWEAAWEAYLAALGLGWIYSLCREEMITRFTEYGEVQDNVREAVGELHNWPRIDLYSTIQQI